MARQTTQQKEFERLRRQLNPAIGGKVVDAVLWALAGKAGAYLVNNVESVHDQVYIATAVDRYLDQRLADYNLIRPTNIGLSDDVFRELGISVVNRKQVRDLIVKLLTTIFGEEATNATSRSSQIEPYELQDGDTIILQFDSGEVVTVPFLASQFSNIALATAQEVADAITRTLRSQGRTGSAFAKDDGNGAYVVLISDTAGSASSVRVLGGRAQNELVFDRARPTSANMSTQWTISQVSGGSLRFTWSGGADPSLGKVRAGDYVNIYSSAFSIENQGTYTIKDVQGGLVNDAFFEVENANGVAETVIQGIDTGVLFFDPVRSTVTSKFRYAAAYQTESRLLELFIPATTKVVRRDRRGAAHIHGPANFEIENYDPGLNEITDITFPAPASINDGDYFFINAASDAVEYVVYLDKGAAVDPGIVGKTSIRVDISSAVTAQDVAQFVATILAGYPDFNSAGAVSGVAKICNSSVGTTTDATNGNIAGLSVSVVQQGSDLIDSVVLVPNPDEAFDNQPGPYIYDLTQPFTVSEVRTDLSLQIDGASSNVISVSNSSDFPDSPGFIILGYGTSNQEGPVPYLGRPSPTSLLINPSYRFKNIHQAGTDVSLISRNGSVQLSQDGEDYPFYVTDVVSGRLYAEELINTVVATGIRVVVTIIYPSDEGLAKWSTEDSDKFYIWGP